MLEGEQEEAKSWEPLKPVTWFLGLEVLAGIRGIILDGIQHDFNMRDWMDPGVPPDFSGQTEVWFDFLADIGDGGRSMGSLAYHLQRDITIAAAASTVRGETSTIAHNDFPLDGKFLKRGQFLFIGGDYAYPRSDKRTIDDRVIAPFRETKPTVNTALPIYGIPANHDYYDDLIGFNRAVRTPIAGGHAAGPSTLAGFMQAQAASYVRIKLPYDWEFWGVDVGTNGIDFRQLLYFRPTGEKRPERLIVCTQKPPIVLDRDDSDDAHKDALAMLALSRKFDALASKPADELGDHVKCRLDLSGDVHHYARYGAETLADGIPAHQYAGVVSGAGGAFLHPTWFDAQTGKQPFTPRRKYPTPQQCTAELACGLLSFVKMVVSGQAWILAGLIALAIYAGSDAWSGFVTALPHRLFGSPTTPITIPCPDIAMTFGFLAAIALPIVWLTVVRPWILGKRSSRRVFANNWPTAKSFTDSVDSWRRKKESAPRRDALDRNPRLALVWVTIQLSVVIGLIVAPPWIVAHCVPGASFGGVLAVLGVVALVAGGLFVGLKVSGAKGPAKLGLFFVLGLIHAGMQVTLPLAALLYRGLVGFVAVFALYSVCSLVVIGISRKLESSSRPKPGSHALPRVAPPPRWFTLLTAALWIVQWPAAIALLALLAPSTIDQSLTFWTGLGAVVAGVVFCVHQFGWYLFVAYLLGAHNNEAGAAVRCEHWKQWIRFHLDKDGVLTGYVIGVDTPVHPRQAVAAAKIVDVFQIKPGGG